MPSESPDPIQLEYTPEFRRNLRALAKKYRHIRSDLQLLLDDLAAGKILGDQVAGTPYTIFKVRVRNTDIAKASPLATA